MTLVVLMSFFCLKWIDSQLSELLLPYLNTEVERITTNIVEKTIHENIIQNMNENYVKINPSTQQISYDIAKINELKEKSTKIVQEKLNQLEDGKIEDSYLSERLQFRYGKFEKAKKGMLCDVSLGSIRGSSLFANVGPSIPLRLLFVGQVQSSVDVEIEEYGINNVLVKVFLNLEMKEQIVMPISSKQITIQVSEPISIDIIKGEVPQYFNGFSKTF